MLEMKAVFLQKISHLIDQFNIKPTNASVVIKEFNSFLKQHPYDTGVWIKYSLVLHFLLKDTVRALECLNSVLQYNPGNVYVTMLLVFISEQMGPMSDELFDKLCELQTPHKEILSLIEYQKSWYYIQKDEEKLCHYSLECSIELCDKFVWNYKALGSLYFLGNDKASGRLLFRKAINNVHHVYSFYEYQSLGAANIDEFFNARLKGTHIMQPIVLMMINALESENR